ncbi:MAG: hypothetical protein LBK47_10010 [Prevotellaceae bacterium]|jgi:hypothetical protein|nr:hypothetical protein [Prevotellaceae bacterium]
MKKTDLYSITAAFAIAAFAAACSKEDVYVGETNIASANSSALPVTGIPFADDQTLTEIAANPKNVPYATARKLAVVEMELGVKESMKWHGTKLLEKPVVIFDGKSNAKYYEFIVADQQGKAVGTVTACAQKESDAVLAYVLPFVRDYTALTTKGSGYKLVSGGYPSRILLGVLGKSGEDPSALIEPETGEAVAEVATEDTQGFIEALSNFSDEEKAAYGIDDVNTLAADVLQQDALNKENAQVFWGLVDSLNEAISAMSDDEITVAANSSKSTWYTYDEYRIPAFYSSGMYYTRWKGWCGPSAIAWIYRGIYSSYYNGTYLPFYYLSGFQKTGYRELESSNTRGYYDFTDKEDDDNDGIQNDLDKNWVGAQSRNADGGLYAKIADESGMHSALVRFFYPTTGVTFPDGLGYALSNVTAGKYKLSSSHLNTLNWGHKHIRNERLPVVCSFFLDEHIVAAFGSRYENFHWDIYIKIFGCKIRISSNYTRTGSWLLIHDNGAFTSKQGYSPYWKYDGLTPHLQFGVVKQY